MSNRITVDVIDHTVVVTDNYAKGEIQLTNPIPADNLELLAAIANAITNDEPADIIEHAAFERLPIVVCGKTYRPNELSVIYQMVISQEI